MFAPGLKLHFSPLPFGPAESPTQQPRAYRKTAPLLRVSSKAQLLYGVTRSPRSATRRVFEEEENEEILLFSDPFTGGAAAGMSEFGERKRSPSRRIPVGGAVRGLVQLLGTWSVPPLPPMPTHPLQRRERAGTPTPRPSHPAPKT